MLPWCKQLFPGSTKGIATFGPLKRQVIGAVAWAKGYDDTKVYHWIDWGAGYWRNKASLYYQNKAYINNYKWQKMTSVTCSGFNNK